MRSKDGFDPEPGCGRGIVGDEQVGYGPGGMVRKEAKSRKLYAGADGEADEAAERQKDLTAGGGFLRGPRQSGSSGREIDPA